MWLLLVACAGPHDAASAGLLPALPGLSRTVVRTDRPVYRAGETVHARIWRVDAVTLLPVPAPLTVSLRSLEGPESDRVALPAGRAAAALRIPIDGWPGAWEVVVSGAAGRLAHQRLAVQASQRLPWRIDAALEQEVVDPGADAVVAHVAVRTPGGAPVAGRGIHAVLRAWGLEDRATTATTGADGAATLSWPVPSTSHGEVAIRVDGVGGPDPRLLPFVVGPATAPAPFEPLAGDLGVEVVAADGAVEVTTTADGRPVAAEVALAVVSDAAFGPPVPPLPDLLRAPSRLPPDPVAEAWSQVGYPALPWPEGVALDPARPAIRPDPSGVWDAPPGTPAEGGGPTIPGPDALRVVVDPPVAGLQEQLRYCAIREAMDGALLNGEVGLRWRGPATARSVEVVSTTLDAPELLDCLVGRLEHRAPTDQGSATIALSMPRVYLAAPEARTSDTAFRPDPRGPETAAWLPSLRTDPTGHLRVPLPALPSGTWRVTVDALGAGAAGTGTAKLQGSGSTDPH